MKNALLVFSVVGTGMLYVLFNTRDFGLCAEVCGDWLDKTQNNFLFFPILLAFSVAVYFMKQQVFKSWWKFARIAVPIIFIISTVINLQFHHRSGGLFNMDNMFDLPILILMYTIFIVGSLVQIYRGYRSK